MDRRVLLGLAGIAGVAALAKLAKAGPLEPPAGPITSTGTTLSELNAKTSEAQLSLSAIDRKVARTPQGVSEPRIPITACPPSADALYVITQPGAYYLVSNIQQQPGKCAIDVQCDNVDIDGQGFSFVGDSSGSSSSPCVRIWSPRSNIELYDCAFAGWTGDCCSAPECTRLCLSDCAFMSCACPAAADGSPGALVRCASGAVLEECVVQTCSGSFLCGDSCSLYDIHVSQSTCMAFCGDGCCVDECEFHNCAAPTATVGAQTGVIRCGHAACITDCLVRSCTCTVAISVGDSSSVCKSATLQVTGSPGGSAMACITTGSKCCISEVECRSCQCAAGFTGPDCVVECCEVAACSSGWVCQDRCCVEDCTFASLSGSAVTCADSCCITECDARHCTCPPGVSVFRTGHSAVVECCEVSGGSGAAITCDASCCIEDCSVVSQQGGAITCADRGSVECCKMSLSGGITCAAECCVCDNEVSFDGSGGTAGGGNAITIAGERCCLSSNYISGRVVIFGGQCLVEDNHLVGSGGPPGTGGASLAIAQGVTGCQVRSNHISRASTTGAISIPAGNSYGPVCNCIGGGDLSVIPGGSHPHANFLY